MEYKPYILLVIVLVSVVSIFMFILQRTQGPSAMGGTYDTFAQCISASGAKFYGAFWCPHCQVQKKLFGASSRYLPYIECSTPDGNSQLQVCKDAGVTNYPTWEFVGGTRVTGEQSFEKLAQETHCVFFAASSTQNTQDTVPQQ